MPTQSSCVISLDRYMDNNCYKTYRLYSLQCHMRTLSKCRTACYFISGENKALNLAQLPPMWLAPHTPIAGLCLQSA